MNAKANPQKRQGGGKVKISFSAIAGQLLALKDEIGRLKRLLSWIVKVLREIRRLLGEENARVERLIRESREIKNLLLGLDADGMPRVNLKGVRRDQFFAAVEMQRRHPQLSPWKCTLAACAEIKPTAANGGYDADNLYRYIRSKPKFFRWKSGKNAVERPEE